MDTTAQAIASYLRAIPTMTSATPCTLTIKGTGTLQHATRNTAPSARAAAPTMKASARTIKTCSTLWAHFPRARATGMWRSASPANRANGNRRLLSGIHRPQAPSGIRHETEIRRISSVRDEFSSRAVGFIRRVDDRSVSRAFPTSALM